jgi:hypothetical protein
MAHSQRRDCEFWNAPIALMIRLSLRGEAIQVRTDDVLRSGLTTLNSFGMPTCVELSAVTLRLRS